MGLKLSPFRLVPSGPTLLFHADPAEHLDGNLLRRLGPDVDDLVVPLAVGDEPLHVLLLDPEHVLVGLGDDLLLVLRDDHVVDRDRNAGLGRKLKSDILQAVGQEDGGLIPAGAVAVVDEVRQLLLVHDLVDRIEGYRFRNHLKQDDPSRRSSL